MNSQLSNLNKLFDHAALKPECDESAIMKLCHEAREHSFFSVAVNPVWVNKAANELQETEVKVLATAGFPLGANRTDIKAQEAARAVKDGATEIDMVANIGWIKSGQFGQVEKEIAEVRKNIPFNVILKVIIEACLLNESEQFTATKAVLNGGAQFVKTGTGFSGEANVEQVRVLHRAAEGKIEVKASGGIRTLQQCHQLVEAGATRLGSSASVAIIQELKQLKAQS